MRRWVFIILVLLSICTFSACNSNAETPETASAPEPTVMVTEPTEAEEEPAPIPIVKSDFIPETIEGQDYYSMDGYAYAAELGAPVLGLDGTVALYQEGDAEAAAKNITNVGDAIHYVMEMEPFSDSKAACEAFLQLLEKDYNDFGYINLLGKDFRYCLVYLLQDGIYYSIDVFSLSNGHSPWTMLPENACTPSEDPYALCDNLASTFPGETVVESWIMDDYNMPNSSGNPTKHLFPWELHGEVLGEEKVTELFETESQYAAERAITTLEDAFTYIKLMGPEAWDVHPMEGRPAWKVLMYMVADDYEDVGLISLLKRKPEHKEGFNDESAYFGNYYICYVKKDGLYYPIDYIEILEGDTSWTLLPENGCYSSPDLNTLCQKMADTCPFVDPHPFAAAVKHDPFTYWEITSYMYHNGTKLIPVSEFIIPEALGHPILSEEEIEALVQETDYEKIAEEITTLGDALHFYNKLRLVKPKYRDTVRQPPFEYFPSAWQVLKNKTAHGFTAGNLTRYLLKEDYDEIGYVFATATRSSSAFMYIYDDGLYYLIAPDTYTCEPREDLWIEWPEVIGCAEDFQTIADSCMEHMAFRTQFDCQYLTGIYRIRSEGDFVLGGGPNFTYRFPEGTEVTRYYGPEFSYAEATLDWQSQTRIDE